MLKKTKLPYANCGLFDVQEDHIQSYQSLDERFIENRSATFFFEARGDSMEPLITAADVLVIDRSKDIRDGKIAVVYLDGEFLCKRVFFKDDCVILKSHNPLHRDIIVTKEMDFLVWGPIITVIRDVRDL